MPTASKLPAPQEALRQVRASNNLLVPGRERIGDDYEYYLPHARLLNYYLDGGATPALGFDPDERYGPQDDGPLAGMAFAIFQFNPAGYLHINSIDLYWHTERIGFGPTVVHWPDSAQIGLANFVTGRWDWYPVPHQGSVKVPDFAPYRSGEDGRVLLCLACSGEKVAILKRIRLSGGSGWAAAFDAPDSDDFNYNNRAGLQALLARPGGDLIAVMSDSPGGELELEADGGIRMLCLDADGGLRWPRYVHYTGHNLRAVKAVLTPDGGIFIQGLCSSNDNLELNNFVLIKLDANGELVWARRSDAKAYTFGYRDPDGAVAASPDGSLYTSLFEYTIDEPNFFGGVLKLDSSGSPQWITSSNTISDFDRVCCDSTSVYAIGDGNKGMVLLSLSPVDGGEVWRQALSIAGSNLSVPGLEPRTGGGAVVLMSHEQVQWSYLRYVNLLSFDAAGALIASSNSGGATHFEPYDLHLTAGELVVDCYSQHSAQEPDPLDPPGTLRLSFTPDLSLSSALHWSSALPWNGDYVRHLFAYDAQGRCFTASTRFSAQAGMSTPLDYPSGPGLVELGESEDMLFEGDFQSSLVELHVSDLPLKGYVAVSDLFYGPLWSIGRLD